MLWNIPLFKMYFNENDIRYVTNVLKRGSYWASGPEIYEFESKISGYVGTKYAITFNSGTSATHALLLAYGIKQNDEVIVPSFSFISTANAPQFVGAKPVFAEIEDKTFGLNPEDIVERITSKTKLIMPIHYGGSPCLIREIREIANDHNLLLIEDAAESLGANIKGKKVGTFGDSAMFSFCQNKIISTGEGGVVTTDSKDIYEKLKLIRSHGRLETQDYFSTTDYMEYVSLGYNFRMPSLNAALGISQLEKIDEIIEMRQQVARYMADKLSEIKEVVLPNSLPDYYHVYQMFTIMVNEDSRDDLIKYLSTNGIMTKVYFDPIHLTKFYRTKYGYNGCDLPFTEMISKKVLSLPIYPSLTVEEIDYIANNIAKFFGKEL